MNIINLETYENLLKDGVEGKDVLGKYIEDGLEELGLKELGEYAEEGLKEVKEDGMGLTYATKDVLKDFSKVDKDRLRDGIKSIVSDKKLMAASAGALGLHLVGCLNPIGPIDYETTHFDVITHSLGGYIAARGAMDFGEEISPKYKSAIREYKEALPAAMALGIGAGWEVWEEFGDEFLNLKAEPCGISYNTAKDLAVDSLGGGLAYFSKDSPGKQEGP